MEGWYINNKDQRDALIKHVDECLEKGEFVRYELHRSSNRRTDKQNRALWKACELLGDALNDAGFDMKTFPFKEGVDVPWDKEQVKKRLFNPIMEAKTDKTTSTRLTKQEVSEIWEILVRHIAQVTGVTVPFPSYNHLYAQAKDPQG